MSVIEDYLEYPDDYASWTEERQNAYREGQVKGIFRGVTLGADRLCETVVSYLIKRRDDSDDPQVQIMINDIVDRIEGESGKIYMYFG